MTHHCNAQIKKLLEEVDELMLTEEFSFHYMVDKKAWQALKKRWLKG